MTRRTIPWLTTVTAAFVLAACSTTLDFDVGSQFSADGTIAADVDAGVATAARGGLSAMSRSGLSLVGVNLGGGNVDYAAPALTVTAGDGVDLADLHDRFAEVGVALWLAPYEAHHDDDPGAIRTDANLLFTGTIDIERVPGEDTWNLEPGRIARDHYDADVFALLEGDQELTLLLEFECRDGDGNVIDVLDGAMLVDGMEIRVRAGL